MRVIVLSSALCAALALGACDAMNSDQRSNAPITEPVQTAITDTVITGKVIAALAVAENVNGTAIDVETVNGRVVLSGRLPNQAQIDRAIAAAKAVEGVREVESRLMVG